MSHSASGDRRGFLRLLAGSPLIARAWAQPAPSEQISSALKSAKDALEDWVLKEKRSWNESYALHAFLQYNSAFEIAYLLEQFCLAPFARLSGRIDAPLLGE